ncbi:MAG: hypothetical protein AVDCRST_MAG30-1407 [uncultured Solirubrobacteraceae bacterium]|uniref:C-type lysozyme inhibitor domain-containing protein n=1 Tax=uncultured Solirubrobacteraceae bacterium TaxID=1162706 RepID=A0A6J4SEX8_9ACTN|nr:MAG: hypothetical protein AVDCRST_MAG30-1407 [uncultured Solirubrobacteraceae bacterium]
MTRSIAAPTVRLFRATALCTCLAALLLGPAATAQAAAPPKGTYHCKYPETNRSFGLITIVDGKSYKFNRKKSGRYKTSGKKITFSSGPMKGVFVNAVWKRVSSATYISLFDGERFGQSYQDVQCQRGKS